MSDIILINRPLVRDNKEFHVSRRKWPPLNLLYIGTILKNNNLPVEIIDARALDYNSEDIKKELQTKKPSVIFIASDPFDFYQCPNPSMTSYYETIEAASLSGANFIVSMGPQATIFASDLLKNTALTHLVLGDDPLTAANLLSNLFQKENFNYPNVAYKNNQEIISGVNKPLTDLDKLPLGDYSLLPMEKYSANMEVFNNKKFSVLAISRGCPYQCQYCFKHLIGNQVRAWSLERIKLELDEMILKNKIEALYFLDDFFTFNKQRILDLCALIKKENYQFIWGCQTRTNAVDEEMLCAMKDAGCVYISYGIESGSQAVEDRSKKNINLSEAEKIIKLTKSIGIHPHINMMYGFPDETKKEFNQSINFLIRHHDFALPGALRFYPGTPYYEQFLPHKNLEEIEKISLDLSLTKLKPKDVARGLAKLVLAKKIYYKEFNLSFIYFLLKYFFPGLIAKIKK